MDDTTSDGTRGVLGVVIGEVLGVVHMPICPLWAYLGHMGIWA